MALIRWEPLREVNSLQREMNRLFDTLTPINGINGDRFLPSVEIKETDDAIQLKAELPGMDINDLDIQVAADSVSISGERKSESKTEEKGVYRSEFYYGSFQRVIPLPARVQNTDANAEYKDGILHLTLPKAEDEKNKVVKVKVS